VFTESGNHLLKSLGVMCIILRGTVIIMCNSYLSERRGWFNQRNNRCFLFSWEFWQSSSCQLKSQAACRGYLPGNFTQKKGKTFYFIRHSDVPLTSAPVPTTSVPVSSIHWKVC